MKWVRYATYTTYELLSTLKLPLRSFETMGIKLERIYLKLRIGFKMPCCFVSNIQIHRRSFEILRRIEWNDAIGIQFTACVVLNWKNKPFQWIIISFFIQPFYALSWFLSLFLSLWFLPLFNNKNHSSVLFRVDFYNNKCKNRNTKNEREKEKKQMNK